MIASKDVNNKIWMAIKPSSLSGNGENPPNTVFHPHLRTLEAVDAVIICWWVFLLVKIDYNFCLDQIKFILCFHFILHS